MIFDLNELNTMFNAETWLQENYGCEFYHNGEWLNSSCPFEDHVDSQPSFGINLQKGIFKCFGCGKEGQLIKMVSMLLKINFYQAVNVISSYAGINLDNIDSLTVKNEKFRKALIETDEQDKKNQRIVQRATIKIKRIMCKDFDNADQLYKQMDEYINNNNYKSIKEMI